MNWTKQEIFNLLDDEDSSVSDFSDELSLPVLPKASPVNEKPINRTNPLLAKEVTSASRFFSASPSLREMMNDYNKRTLRRTPLKKNDESTKALLKSGVTFKTTEVEFIEIPHEIPGKILRPVS